MDYITFPNACVQAGLELFRYDGSILLMLTIKIWSAHCTALMLTQGYCYGNQTIRTPLPVLLKDKIDIFSPLKIQHCSIAESGVWI